LWFYYIPVVVYLLISKYTQLILFHVDWMYISDEEPKQMTFDNLPPEVTAEDCDLYKQVREKALQVYMCVMCYILFRPSSDTV